MILLIAICVCLGSAHCELNLPVPAPALYYDDVHMPHSTLDTDTGENNGDNLNMVNKTGYIERATRGAKYTNADLRSKFVSANGQINNNPSNSSIEIKATTFTSDLAHYKAAYIISQMVKDMSSDQFLRAAHGTKVGVFTKSETLVSFPEYHYMADTPACAGRCGGACRETCTFDGRKWFRLVGAGGRIAVAMAENIMCSSEDPNSRGYNALIHEYGHTLHQYALPQDTENKIIAAYNQARVLSTWPLTTYAMSNKDEYFGSGTSVFFNANHRNYRGNSMNSCHQARPCRSWREGRDKLQQNDPDLYSILSDIYTNNRPDLPTVLSPCV